MNKILSFAVPCYNSEAYMEKCINSLLPGGDDIEIIIVDDGSSDRTAEIADRYEKEYPGIIRAIHQENAGHGGAVNTGIRNAEGMYFKVVDSDDWLDHDSYMVVLDRLKTFRRERKRVDMLIANYVYDHVDDGTSHSISYTNALPQEKVFGWSHVRHFRLDQNLLMHSVIYRTKVLKESKMVLPEHTFYVDNLFVYVPLPYVKTLYYIDVDLYRYYIGREDQSVNEQIMINRIDQQIYVNKLMIDAYDIPSDIKNKHLAAYLFSYLGTICAVTSVLLMVSKKPENLQKKKELWKYLKRRSPRMYWKIRTNFKGIVSNPYCAVDRMLVLKIYKIAQKIYRFN